MRIVDGSSTRVEEKAEKREIVCSAPDEVRDGERLIALIIRASYQATGIKFFTDRSLSQQLGYMRRPKGYVIGAHVHNKVHRDVDYTQEVLVVRKGRLRVDLYDAEHRFLTDRILEPGDIILLASGGHGFEMLDEVEMVEVKQGPYTPTDDKTFFTQARPRDEQGLSRETLPRAGAQCEKVRG